MAYVDLKSKFISDLDAELNPDLSKERIIILNTEGETTTANTVLVEDFHENNRPGYRHLESGVLLLQNGSYRGSTWQSNYMGEGIDGGEPFFKDEAINLITQSNGTLWKGFNGSLVVEDLVPRAARAVAVTVGNTNGIIGGWPRFWSWNGSHYHDHICYGDRWNHSFYLNVHSLNTTARDVPWSFPIIPSWDDYQKKWYRAIRVAIDNHGRNVGFGLWLRGYWI